MRKKPEYRLLISFTLVSMLSLFVFARAGYIMLKRHERLDILVERQFNNLPDIRLRRGKIYDRNGDVLALSLPVKSLYANPIKIRDKRRLARHLSSILKIPYASLLTRLKSRRNFIFIRRKLGFSEEEAVREFLDRNQKYSKSVGLLEDSKRFFPNKRMASHVLGFTGVDSNGLEGIELQYDRVLSTTKKGQIEGDSLRLTIDSVLQTEAERQLKTAVESSGAKSGSVVVMDALNGEIWALANYPDYDPNRFSRFPASVRRNRALTDIYEPGSTMKVFTVAAAIESGLLELNKKIYCEAGRFKIGKHYIRESDPSKRFHWLLPEEIIKHSSNIGAVKIGQRIGSASLYSFLENLHFKNETGIDLPGEINPRLRDRESLSEVGYANVTFGQGLSTTSIKMAQLYASIANGGYLVKPLIVRDVINYEGKTVKRYKTDVQAQAMKPETTIMLAKIMQSVTEPDGGGFRAAIDGLNIPGKTGTAQKATREKGYASGKYTASFAGFVQQANPRFVAYVTIDEPSPPDHFGGRVAAPLFKKVMQFALARTGVVPMRVQLAEKSDVPAKPPREKDGSHEPETLLMGTKQLNKMPNLIGLSSREVLRMFRHHEVKINGRGMVIEQLPRMGTKLKAGDKVVVKMSTDKLMQ